MQNLSNISVIKEILSQHGFTFSKGLGQNFLTNPTVCPRMAELCGADKNAGVLEIGAGIGVLTKELAQVADKVVCVEIDKRLLPVLDKTLAEYDNIKIINDDVLKVDLEKLLMEEFGDRDVHVCANLPYYITSPVIMHLLESRLKIKSITVMVQKEAALRITAPEGSRDTGAITVSIRYYADPKLLFHVSKGSFIPSPDVDSAVIRLDLYDKPPINISDEAKFFEVVKATFSQRRKTVLNSLCSYFKIEKSKMEEMLTSKGISPSVRPEKLLLTDFATISEGIAELVNAQEGQS